MNKSELSGVVFLDLRMAFNLLVGITRDNNIVGTHILIMYAKQYREESSFFLLFFFFLGGGGSKIRHTADINTRKSFFDAHIKPHIDYASVVFGTDVATFSKRD